MRCFIVITLDERVKSQLDIIQQKLRSYGIYGNYTRYGNLHLTVKFLGEVNNQGIHRVSAIFKKLAAETEPFDIQLDKLGAFHKGNRSILWFGLMPSSRLGSLKNLLENEIKGQLPGVDSEWNYHPHITLVREAKLPQEGLAASVDTLKSQIGPLTNVMRAASITLMESTREAGTLVYKPIMVEPFRH